MLETSSISIHERLGAQAARHLLETWAPRLEAVRQVKNGWEDESALRLAQILENTNMAFERASTRLGGLNEATQTGDVGAFKQYYFDIITAIMPNLIAQDIVSVQPIAQKIGQVFYLRYIYGNTKGSVTKGDVMNDPRTGESLAPGSLSYSSDTIDQEIIGAPGDTDYSGNFSYIPIKPGSISIEVNGVVITDNGSGVLTTTSGGVLTATAGQNIVNYDTGSFRIQFTAPSADNLTATYDYNNEYAPAQVPEINIQVAESTLQARSRKLKALYAMDAAYDLRMQHGVDIDDAMLQAVSQEIMHELDGEICNDLLQQANLTSTWDRTPPNNSLAWQNHRETIIDELISSGNKIFRATQRAVGNFVICGTAVSTVLEGIGAPRFVAAGGAVNGPHFAGTIDGRWKVYKNPYYAPNSYLVGYKGELFLDAGYVFAPYLPVFTTQLIMMDDFVGRRGFATSNAKKMLNPNLYVRGTMVQTADTSVYPANYNWTDQSQQLI